MFKYHLITNKKPISKLNKPTQNRLSLFLIGLLLLSLLDCNIANAPIPTHTISFKLNGGTFSNPQVNTLEVVDGEVINQTQLKKILSYPPTGPNLDYLPITREIFQWQTNGVEYDLSALVTSNLTIEAVWSNSCGVVETFHPANKDELKAYTDKAITTNSTTNLNHINTSAITDMASLFKEKHKFNGNIECWNTTKTTSMRDMFAGAQEFDQNIGTWNVSQVTDMSSMFNNASKFNQNLSGWAVDAVTSYSSIFTSSAMESYAMNNYDYANYPPKFRPPESKVTPTITSISVTDDSKPLLQGKSSYLSFVFSKEVTNFTIDDIQFLPTGVRADKGSFVTNSPISYSLEVTPQSVGDLKVTIPDNSFKDLFGNENTTSFSTNFSVKDNIPPTVTINSATLIDGESAYLSFIFSEMTTNFTPDDIIFTPNDNVADKGSFFTNSLLNYSLEITPKAVGTLKVTIPANSFEDLYGNQNTKAFTANFKVLASTTTTHTISFILNGGKYTFPQITTLQVVDGEAIDESWLGGILFYPPTGPQPDIQAVTRDLFEWQNNQTKYDFSTIVTSDLTLEAVWSNSCSKVEAVHPKNRGELQAYVTTAINADPSTNLNHIDTSAITDMANLFKGKDKFNGKISCWNVSKVNNMAYMFNGSESFNQDIGNWNVSNVNNMVFMFASSKSFNQDIGNWNVSNVNNMASMFAGSESFNQDIGNWNVSNVNNMTYMFNGASAFNQDISTWDVSSVNNMQSMFNGASAFNQNISTWDVSNVTQMSSMFKNTEVFNQDIGTWNVSNVTSMSEMFADSKAFNGDISNWNVSRVTTMNSMFENAKAFNQNIGSWDVSSAIYMRKMFKSTKVFNQSIGSWDVSSVTDMSSMFNEAQVFNQNIGTWDVSSVTDMSSMFKYAYAFNQNLSGWSVGAVTSYNDVFTGSPMAKAEYSYKRPKFSTQ